MLMDEPKRLVLDCKLLVSEVDSDAIYYIFVEYSTPVSSISVRHSAKLKESEVD